MNIIELDKQLKETEKRLESIKINIIQKQDEINQYQEKIDRLECYFHEAEDEYDYYKEECEDYEREIEELKSKLEEYRDKRDAMPDAISNIKENLDYTKYLMSRTEHYIQSNRDEVTTLENKHGILLGEKICKSIYNINEDNTVYEKLYRDTPTLCTKMIKKNLKTVVHFDGKETA